MFNDTDSCNNPTSVSDSNGDDKFQETQPSVEFETETQSNFIVSHHLLKQILWEKLNSVSTSNSSVLVYRGPGVLQSQCSNNKLSTSPHPNVLVRWSTEAP